MKIALIRKIHLKKAIILIVQHVSMFAVLLFRKKKTIYENFRKETTGKINSQHTKRRDFIYFKVV